MSTIAALKTFLRILLGKTRSRGLDAFKDVPTIIDVCDCDQVHREAYEHQIRDTFGLIKKNPWFRYTVFGEALIAKDCLNEIESMLCVGCRNAFELDYFESLGVNSVRGADLVSVDPRIMISDMCSLVFGDSEFDALYAGDSFEHALDPEMAAKEFLRVVKPGGLIALAVPANYQVDEVDRVPFTDFSDLYAYFGDGVAEILFEEPKKSDDGRVTGLQSIFRTPSGSGGHADDGS